eukprot:TRINITY_DN53116_c0_g1_i1.p1 TRINITY_DN53116_c0_g1~~TRINITY_DN53116_c0_g1_i1.p1  ORF type:complete len:380 (-),score=47.74 TRINITY_DN53116_c0_g1_i1:143-1282(-)
MLPALEERMEALALGPDDIEVKTSRAVHRGFMEGAIKNSGVSVAVKSFKIEDSTARRQLLQQIKELAQGHASPNLIQVLTAFEGSRAETIQVVTELADLGSLEDLMRRVRRLGRCGIPSPILACMTRQIAAGVAYLHSHELLVRHMELESIIHSTPGLVKLAEYGALGQAAAAEAFGMCLRAPATISMSPEECTGVDSSYPSDLWKFGLVVYELACGQHPFSVLGSFPATVMAVMRQPGPHLNKTTFSPELCNFVTCCLQHDVSSRSDIAALSCHKFIESEPLEILSACLQVHSEDKGVEVTVFDLGGNEKSRAVLATSASIAELERELRHAFPSFSKLLHEDGDVPADVLVKDCVPMLSFAVTNKALAWYFASLKGAG